jgi:lipopolysaccharide transport system ATP-binding protein
MSVVIKVENIRKKYIIRHETEHNYVALRDVIADKVKGVVRKAGSLVNKKYQTPEEKQEEFWALNGVSFDVNDGDRLGIIGRNGAGKSTLLKVLSRITDPTEGRISSKGRIASLLEVGTGFHPELTGRENIYLNGAILGMHRSEIRSKFDEIVEFSGVSKFLDTPVKRYSSGMYVRLAFSVAAHLEPEILIIDEVLAVGDAEFQKRCLGKMEDVGRQGRTVLFVSHNLAAIEQLCNRCLLIQSGTLKYQSSDVKDVIKKYILSSTNDVKCSEWLNAENRYQNEWFKPSRFALVDENGTTLEMPVRNDSAIYVQVEGKVETVSEKLTLGYYIYNEENIVIYHSATHDVNEEQMVRWTKGHNVVRTQIPRHFLNEDDYRIELVIFMHGEFYISRQMKDSPSIFLQIEGGLSDSKRWLERRQGIIAPVLNWEKV